MPMNMPRMVRRIAAIAASLAGAAALAGAANAATPPITTGVSPIGGWSSTYSGEPFSLTLVPDGSAVLSGNLYAPVTFGSFAAPAAVGYNAFMAKTAADGSWTAVAATNATTNDFAGYNSVVVKDGGLRQAASFPANSVVGATTVVTNQDGVAAANPDGSWAWAAIPDAGTFGSVNSIGLARSGEGPVFVGTGVEKNASITLGTSVISNPPSASYDKLVVAGLAPDGSSWLWAATAEPVSGEARINGVQVADDGSAVITGYLDGTYDFGGHVVSGAGHTFYAKLAADHSTWVWATSVKLGSSYWNGASFNASLAPDGSVYVSGMTDNGGAPAVFGSTTLTNADGRAVIAKINPDGTWAWAHAVGGSTLGFGVSYVEGCGVMLTGGFAGAGTFGSTTLTAQATGDGFIAAVDPNGSWTWASNFHLTSNSTPWAYSMAVVDGLPDGTIAVLAQLGDSALPFGTITVPSSDGFVGRMLQAPCVAPQNVKATAGDGKATVSWDAVPGPSVTSYTVTAGPGGKSCTVTAPATSCVIEGLTNGTQYTFKVVAVNAAGTGPESTEAKATPTAAASNSQAAAEDSPKITIPAASVSSGATLTSTVSPSVAGTVKVTATLAGRTVCTATKKATRAGRMTVTCNLTKGAKAVISKKAVTLKVTARLTDAAGKIATASRNVKVARYVVRTPVTG